jgi:K+-sensing histidine kinase KdpD
MSLGTSAVAVPAEVALARLFSHDLRTPLGPLVLAISTLADDPSLDEDARDLARMAVAQCARMRRLLEASLAALEPPVVEIGTVDLGSVVRDAAESIAELGGTCAIDIIAAGPARGDAARIREALIGLVEVAGGSHARTTIVVRGEPHRQVIVVRGDAAIEEPDAGAPASARAALLLGGRALFEACGGGVALGEEVVAWLPSV